MATLILGADEVFEESFQYDEDLRMVVPVDNIDVIIKRHGHTTEILKSPLVDETEIYKY